MQIKNPRGAGRKPIPIEERKDCYMNFWVSKKDKEKITLFLENKGIKLREFILEKIKEGENKCIKK